MIKNIDIYAAGTSQVKTNVLIMPQSVYHTELMTSEYVVLIFNLSNYVDFNLGDYVIYEGKVYKLTDMVTPSRGNQGGYSYRLQFNAEWMEWEHRLMFYDRGLAYEAKWNMTQKPAYFLDIVASNIQCEGMAVFDTPIIDSSLAEMKYISFESDGIISALNKIAAAWECEWWLTYYNDMYTIHLGFNKGEGQTSVTLTDGDDIATVTRQDSQQKNVITRLYPFGSDRNISNYYRKSLVFTAQDADDMAYINSHLPQGFTGAICDKCRKLLTDYFDEADKVYKDAQTIGRGDMTIYSQYPVIFVEDKISEYIYRNLNFDIPEGESGDYKVHITANIEQELTRVGSAGYTVQADTETGGYRVYIKDDTTKTILYTWNIPTDSFKNVTGRYTLNGDCVIPIIYGHSYSVVYESEFLPYNKEDRTKGNTIGLRIAGNCELTYQNNIPSVNVSFVANNRTYNGVFNPWHNNRDSKLYNMIAYTGVKIPNGTQYTINNLHKYDVPASYLTSNVASVVSGVAEPVLLLPDEPCFKGADGKIYRRSEIVSTQGYTEVYNGLGYVDTQDNLEEWETIEGKAVFADVYPRLVATITDVKTKDYVDGETPFLAYLIKANEYVDFTDKWRVDGKDLQVTFQTGDLAGFTFDVNLVDVYNESKREYETYFEVLRNDEEYGVPIPNPNLKPISGNQFILSGFNIDYVDAAYTPKAEVELLEEALTYLEEQAKDTSVYACKMNMINAITRGLTDLKVGQSVTFISTLYGTRQSRIRAIEKNLDGRSLTYTLGKSAAYSRFSSIEQTIEGLSYLAKGLSSTPSGGVNESLLQQKLDEVRKEIKENYLNKQEDDFAKGDYNFEGGIEFGEKQNEEKSFLQNAKGAKIWYDGTGWRMQCDYLTVTKKMYAKEVQVDEVSHVGGQLLLTSASCIAEAVQEIVSYGVTTGYRVYFRKEDGQGRKVYNEWKVNDYAYCQSMTIDKGVTQDFTNRYYWMLVTEVGEDGDFHYITLNTRTSDRTGELAVTDDYTTTPQTGDNIVQLGHKQVGETPTADEAARQGAVFISGGAAGQYIAIFQGIKTFVLPTPKILLSPQKVSITADEIKLASKGVLELSSNQLVCTNEDGEKTMWLDEKGNVNIAGILNRASLNIEGDAFNYFFQKAHFNEAAAYIKNNFSSDNDEFLEKYPDSDWLLPDLFKIDGVITLGYQSTEGGDFYADNMLLPFVLPVAYDTREHFDVCRIVTNNGGEQHFITWNELNAIVGRSITIYNNGADIDIHYPNLIDRTTYKGTKMVEQYELDTESPYPYERISHGQSLTIEMVCSTVMYKNSSGNPTYGLGIFPKLKNIVTHSTPEHTPEWEN